MKTTRRNSAYTLNYNLRTPPSFILLLCPFFFIAGFFASSFFFQHRISYSSRWNTFLEQRDLHLHSHGDTGDSSFTLIPFQVLSWKPRTLYFPNFASVEQCLRVIDMAKKNLTPSALALRIGETENNTTGVRTSSGVFISASEDESGVLDYIETKIAKATMIPRINGEAFNILRYEIGQKYDSHFDAFSPSEYGPQKSQRVASFLVYLSDVEEGGETMFPYEDNSNMDGGYDFKDCIGFKFKPRQGDGLLFYSLFPNGTIDQASLHGSCPVIKGEKWVATKWIRDVEDI